VSPKLKPKQSALTLWQVECENGSSGNTVLWGNLCKIKHLATGKYLAVKEKDSQQVLCLCELNEIDFSKSSHFFPFPVSKGEKYINFAAYARFQHEATEVRRTTSHFTPDSSIRDGFMQSESITTKVKKSPMTII